MRWSGGFSHLNSESVAWQGAAYSPTRPGGANAPVKKSGDNGGDGSARHPQWSAIRSHKSNQQAGAEVAVPSKSGCHYNFAKKTTECGLRGSARSGSSSTSNSSDGSSPNGNSKGKYRHNPKPAHSAASVAAAAASKAGEKGMGGKYLGMLFKNRDDPLLSGDQEGVMK